MSARWRPHTPENWNAKKAFQFESLIIAEQFWSDVDAASGLNSGYGRTGRLQPIQDKRTLELAQARAVSAAELWEGNATWQVRPARDFGDWSPPSVTGFLIQDSLTARIDPRRACDSLASALTARGVDLQTDAAIEGKVVWATGYEGLLALSKELKRPVGNGVKGQAALLRYEARAAPQLFADNVHIVPHDNGTLAVGSTSEREFELPDTADHQLDTVLARAVAVCPMLRDAAVLSRWAGVRPRAKSRAPMLGAYPGRDGQYVANGGFKIGFGMAPKVAEVMADLVLEARDTIPDEFRVEANF